jgi:hypothetical protein
MKFTVCIKCPDALLQAIEKEAENEIGGPPDSEENDIAFEELVEKVKKIAGKWFKYGEYIRITIDTDAETCIVQPA